MPGFVLDIQPEYDQAVFVLSFDPIHDGLHRCAGKSIRRLELEQDGHALSDARLDLGSVITLGGLARVKEDPGCAQSEYQHAKGKKLGPFRVPAQQDETRDCYQECCDPNSRILIEDLHYAPRDMQNQNRQG